MEDKNKYVIKLTTTTDTPEVGLTSVTRAN